MQVSIICTILYSMTGMVISSNCSRIRFSLKRHNINVTIFYLKNRSMTFKLCRLKKNDILQQLCDMATPVIQ